VNQHLKPNLLHWPSPGAQKKAYALSDYPRFFVPSWDLTPAPARVDPALKATNGYDFRNNVEGDTYIFLLGEGVESWHSSRAEFVALAGSTPLLPDYAFGTWFTWWHAFTLADCKSNVTRWEDDKLPLDIWALDMNWRNTGEDTTPGETGQTQDHFYDHPNSVRFPGDGPYGSSYTQWFDWLKTQKLRTYFNDHPFPVAARNAGGLQTVRTRAQQPYNHTTVQSHDRAYPHICYTFTHAYSQYATHTPHLHSCTSPQSPEEVAFRWEGLSTWMERGLTFWWFDHNWKFRWVRR
jgi:hypothetical protein